MGRFGGAGFFKFNNFKPYLGLLVSDVRLEGQLLLVLLHRGEVHLLVLLVLLLVPCLDAVLHCGVPLIRDDFGDLGDRQLRILLDQLVVPVLFVHEKRRYRSFGFLELKNG